MDLPAELRLKIWELCLPERYIEVDGSFGLDQYYSDYLWYGGRPCDWRFASKINDNLPVLARVCHESRKIVVDRCQPVYELERERLWTDPTRCRAHWNDFNDIMYCDYMDQSIDIQEQSLGLRLGGSLSCGFLHSRDGKHTGEHLRCFSLQPVWRIIMRVIVIHSNDDALCASDLFGHLGDAPIQIVDLDDEKRLDTYWRLAEECDHDRDLTFRQNFDRPSQSTVAEDLRYGLLLAAGEQSDLKAIPAVEFRWCRRMCTGHSRKRMI